MAKQISFARSVYLPEAVEAAAAAYAEHAKIDVTLANDASIAVMSDVAESDQEFVAHAFCNYVLHETIARIRQATMREVG